MPVLHSILTDPAVVIVRGAGQIARTDIENYLAATVEEGVKAHAKLILLGNSMMALSPADLDAVADRLSPMRLASDPVPWRWWRAMRSTSTWPCC